MEFCKRKNRERNTPRQLRGKKLRANNLSIRIRNTLMRDITACRSRQQRWEYTLPPRSVFPFCFIPSNLSRGERQCHHSDLVFFQDTVLLKRELLKTATLNAPTGPPGVWQWAAFFFLPALSLALFVFFPPQFFFRHSGTSKPLPVAFIVARLVR